MTIQILSSENIKISNVISIAKRKAAAEWEFQTGNWTYRHTGTYKQACYLAKKFYKRNFQSDFGQLFITKANEVENPNHPQQKLSLGE